MKTDTKRDRFIAIAAIIYGIAVICYAEQSLTWKIISACVGLLSVAGVLYDLRSSKSEWFYGELMDVFRESSDESEKRIVPNSGENQTVSVGHLRLAVRIVTFILLLYIPLRSVYLDYMHTLEYGREPTFFYSVMLPAGIGDAIMLWTWFTEWKAKQLRKKCRTQSGIL